MIASLLSCCFYGVVAPSSDRVARIAWDCEDPVAAASVRALKRLTLIEFAYTKVETPSLVVPRLSSVRRRLSSSAT